MKLRKLGSKVGNHREYINQNTRNLKRAKARIISYEEHKWLNNQEYKEKK